MIGPEIRGKYGIEKPENIKMKLNMKYTCSNHTYSHRRVTTRHGNIHLTQFNRKTAQYLGPRHGRVFERIKCEN